MRIFTCTPVDFGGGADFFARDSGLLCRGFQAAGVESRAVMPGERRPGDEEDLIRGDFGSLEEPEWWRDCGLDGVVLYAWGSPKFRKVAKAIRDAGLFLVLNQDNGGLVSPLAGLRDWWSEQRNVSGGGAALWKLAAKGMSHGLLVTDPRRAAHLGCGDIIACVSPRAAERYRHLCRIYGGEGLASRVRVLPHAVEPRFRCLDISRKRQIACIGRWEDHVQKRPDLLMRVTGELLDRDFSATVVIAGRATPAMVAWHRALPADAAARVRLIGHSGREELVEVLNESQVFYSPSAFESFGIAAAEALCCGCSVVAAESVSMAAFEWFVSEDSGKLCGIDDVTGHVDALLGELDAWHVGLRDAQGISTTWAERLHADRLARTILEWAGHCGG
jgi:glycosyltransferase involved in cell wall biosynthesis